MANLTRIVNTRHIAGRLASFVRHLTSNIQNSSPLPLSTRIAAANLVQNPWIWQQHEKIKLPITSKINIDLPNTLKWVPPLEEPTEKLEIEMPPLINDNSLEAARLIVIRRKKMKKHKLKKLRKRMKYEWAKRRQRREWKKEKEFQAVLIAQCKKAESFSAEAYVNERLEQYNSVLESPKFKYTPIN